MQGTHRASPGQASLVPFFTCSVQLTSRWCGQALARFSPIAEGWKCYHFRMFVPVPTSTAPIKCLGCRTPIIKPTATQESWLGDWFPQFICTYFFSPETTSAANADSFWQIKSLPSFQQGHMKRKRQSLGFSKQIVRNAKYFQAHNLYSHHSSSPVQKRHIFQC